MINTRASRTTRTHTRATLSTRRALLTIVVLIPLVWACFLVFTYFVPPHTFLVYFTFFVLLGVALTCTFTPFAYFIGRRFLTPRRYRVSIHQSLREGALLSLAIILNLSLRSLHSWNIFACIVIFGAIILIEVLFLVRK